MANPSNLYAEKIYSEHPLVLWALDDNLDYKSLISEAQRNIATLWTPTSATLTASAADIDEPFLDSSLSRIRVNVPVSETLEASIVSPNILNFNTLADLGTFTVGSYFYSSSLFLQTVSIGYEYTDPATSTIVQNLKTFTSSLYQKWGFISETFEIPNVSAQLRLVIKIKVFEGSVIPADNEFYINGITLGQQNEEFNATSLGIITTTTPASITSPYGSQEAVEAQAYGVSEDSGYYLVSDNELLCKNTGIPLVYGASGVTKIIPNTSESASLILPGKGFLNKKGQYNEYTAEFWLRLNYKNIQPFKIFGPVASDDGLYVEGGFLTLVIGNEFASHSVSEWFRPMLIHIRLIKDKATLLLNGEEVFSLFFNTEDLALPSELDESGDDQDWVGFYANSDTDVFEIDCFAIYSYPVSVLLAKRRWVYGQGVSSLETINSVYGGATAFIDYSFADYTANYNYPDFAKWEQGTFDNLLTTKTHLRTPEYSLPEIFLGTKTLQELYDENKDVQDNESGPVITDKFLSFRPNNTWNSIKSYINFSNFNLLSSEVEGCYGVFSSHNLASDEILFKIYNPLNNNYFTILKDGNLIKYSLTYNGTTQLLFTSSAITANSLFAVGFNIKTLSERFGNNISSFFGNQSSLKMYVCGDDSGDYTFTGRLYSIGLSTTLNSTKITTYVDVDGFIELDKGQELIDHTASYTLLPFEVYNKYFLDVGVSGYWQDYLPLSYFGQFVENRDGDDFYDLDFLQFNVGYPTTLSLTEESGDSFYYNTSGSEVKSYLTFQYLADGANIPTSFENQEAPNEYNIVDLDNHPDWENTRFEILNNTLIYPTKLTNFNNLAIVYSLDFNSRRTLTKPTLINRLQLASQALNANSFNPVGTKFGLDISPYKRNGIYYDYKTKNPFSIYKESTPYLYLTKNSGIEVRGEFNILENRGLSLPINKELASTYKISAVQLWLKYSKELFPAVATELFEINHKGGKIKFYIKANTVNGDRARIFAKNQNGLDYNGLAFYLNGKLVREPVLSLREWASISISFLTPLTFNSYLGSLNITGPAVFNNISYYKADSVTEVESISERNWSKVLLGEEGVLNWQFWVNNDFTWNGMLILSSSEFYGINPSDIYKTYLGINKIIFDDDEGHIFKKTRSSIHKDVTFVNVVTTPV
jgi:hypothetical protein